MFRGLGVGVGSKSKSRGNCAGPNAKKTCQEP